MTGLPGALYRLARRLLLPGLGAGERREMDDLIAERLRAAGPGRPSRAAVWAKELLDLPRARWRARPKTTAATSTRSRVLGMLESLWQDTCHAAALCRRQPLFTGSAILMLAIGSGLITVLFAWSYATFYRPWPVPYPGSMLRVQSRPATANSDFAAISMAEYGYLAARTRTFAQLAATSRSTTRPIEYAGRSVGDAATIYVSHRYFDALSAGMIAGRDFLPGDDDHMAPRAVAVMSNRLWRDRFNGDPGVVGQTIRVRQQPFTIVGVSSLSWFPEATGQPYDLALPLAAIVLDRGPGASDAFTDPRDRDPLFTVAGRLGPGTDSAAAVVELTALSRQFRDTHALPPIEVVAFDTRPVSRGRSDTLQVAQLLFLALVLVQMLACANVGNLLLARGLARQREIAIRLALGAGRRRLIRQLLTEAGVLALAASSFGVALAFVVPVLLERYAIPDVAERARTYAPDAPVLWFAFGLAAVTTMLAGLLPALRSTRATAGLRVSGHHGPTPSTLRLRRALLSAQVALATVLLVGAGLMTRAVGHASRLDPGFAIHELQAIEVAPSAAPSIEGRTAFFQALTDALRASGLPPVALVSNPPLADDRWVMRVRHPHEVDGRVHTLKRIDVSSNYFDVTGIAVVQGRAPRDDLETEIAVSESGALELWPNGDALGRTLLAGSDPRDLDEYLVVGVVRDIAVTDLVEVGPTVYRGAGFPAPTLLVRSIAPSTTEQIRAIAVGLDPDARVTIYPLADNIRGSLQPAIVAGQVAWAIGALALLLATAGAFGVFAYAVEERRREIGIRLALGGRALQVVRSVWTTSLRAGAAGVAAGLVIAAAAAQLLRSFLYGLSPFDPVAYLEIAGILLAAGALATWIPARRATRVDPAVTLRCE